MTLQRNRFFDRFNTFRRLTYDPMAIRKIRISFGQSVQMADGVRIHEPANLHVSDLTYYNLHFIDARGFFIPVQIFSSMMVSVQRVGKIGCMGLRMILIQLCTQSDCFYQDFGGFSVLLKTNQINR